MSHRPDHKVLSLPLDRIEQDGFESFRRGPYLSANDIGELIGLEPIHFILADVGLPLEIVGPADRFRFWKAEVKGHIADAAAPIRLGEFPNEYAYLASRWTNGRQVVVLLEKMH